MESPDDVNCRAIPWVAGAGAEIERPWAARNSRNIGSDQALPSVPLAARRSRRLRIEVTMATRENEQIVETPTEARQAEPGPSVLSLLAISTGLAVLILGVIWFVFFRS
jgi:hypothetical protein